MSKFDYFVVFAEMRTGSNFLEANLNAFDGIVCHGEAFNPHFIGYPNKDNILGVSQAQRDANANHLIDTIKAHSDGLGGFRYFHDHDPRVLDIALSDPRCAKIVLTRNPVDSYVSWKIAQATGQWKLTNVKNVRSETVTFNAEEFENHLTALQEFQIFLLNSLQKTGQTAFYVAYEDLQDVEVMNGLAAFLGTDARLEALDKTLKKQNPEPISEKVNNFDAMERTLTRLDRFNLSRTPNFEPRRGAMIPQYVAAAETPLMFMPIKGGPEAAVAEWLTNLDDAPVVDGFTQKTVRQWKRSNPGHRSFTVVRHPLARAHAAFCKHILGLDDGPVFGEIRKTLRQMFKVPIPKDTPPDEAYDDDTHRAAFLSFLGFLKANVQAQTAIRVDNSWASQWAVVQGFSNFVTPDIIIREDQMALDLAYLAASVGRTDAPDFAAVTDPYADRLARIYDAELEKASNDAYSRDYMSFGFGAWRA
jgi:LPS sulfotransferase NodH